MFFFWDIAPSSGHEPQIGKSHPSGKTTQTTHQNTHQYMHHVNSKNLGEKDLIPQKFKYRRFYYLVFPKFRYLIKMQQKNSESRTGELLQDISPVPIKKSHYYYFDKFLILSLELGVFHSWFMSFLLNLMGNLQLLTNHKKNFFSVNIRAQKPISRMTNYPMNKNITSVPFTTQIIGDQLSGYKLVPISVLY
jgi:hypothetical protein